MSTGTSGYLGNVSEKNRAEGLTYDELAATTLLHGSPAKPRSEDPSILPRLIRGYADSWAVISEWRARRRTGESKITTAWMRKPAAATSRPVSAP